jgi:WD40 repeat protein
MLATLSLSFPIKADEPSPAMDYYGDPLPQGAIARLGTLRFRAVVGVHLLAYSADGKRLLSQGDEAVAIWDAKTGIKQVEFAGQRIGPLIWRGDGRGIALIQDASGAFRFGDFTQESLISRTHESVRELQPPSEEKIRSRGISPDGKYFVAADRTATVSVWALMPGMPLASLKVLHVLPLRQAMCHQVLFSPESRFVGILSGDSFRRPDLPPSSEFTLYELSTGKECDRRSIAMPGLGDGHLTAALGRDGRTLVVGGYDNRFRIYDLGGKDAEIVVGFEKSPEAFSGWSAVAIAGKRVLAARFWDEHLHGFDLNTGEPVAPTIKIGCWVNCLAVSADGTRLATNTGRGAIRQWDLATGREIERVSGAARPIKQIRALSDGRRAVTWGDDFNPRVWDLATGKELLHITFPATATDVDLAPDAKTLLARLGGRLVRYDLDTGRSLAMPGNLSNAKGKLQPPSANARSLLLVDTEVVEIWDWPAGRLRHAFDLKKHKTRTWTGAVAQLSPDSRWLAVRVQQGILIWNAESGEPKSLLRDLVGNPSTALGAPRQIDGFLSSERPFAFVSGHELVTRRDMLNRFGVWDVRSGEVHRTFVETRDRYRYSHFNLAVDADAYLVATMDSPNYPLRIYETASGQIRRVLRHEDHDVQSLAFTPDRKFILTAADDTTCLVWDVSLKEAARGKKAASHKELERAWETLTHPNAAEAYEGMIAFAGNPEQGASLLRRQLKPAAKFDSAALEKIFTGLESEMFAARDKAANDLERLGRGVLPAVQSRLAKTESLEVKRRLAIFLERHDSDTLTSDEVRAVRAVEVLEHMASPEARKLLAELATGQPTAVLTIRAAAASTRLSGLP